MQTSTTGRWSLTIAQIVVAMTVAACQPGKAPAPSGPPDCRVLQGVFVAGNAAYQPHGSGPLIVGGQPSVVLPGCRAVGSPGYQSQQYAARCASLARSGAQLALFAPQVPQRVGLNVTAGQSYAFQAELKQRLVSPAPAVVRSQLQGACQGATHWVRALAVGDYAVRRAGEARAGIAWKSIGASAGSDETVVDQGFAIPLVVHLEPIAETAGALPCARGYVRLPGSGINCLPTPSSRKYRLRLTVFLADPECKEELRVVAQVADQDVESADSPANVCSWTYDFNRRFSAGELSNSGAVRLRFWERDRFVNPNDHLGDCVLFVPPLHLAKAIAKGSYSSGKLHCEKTSYQVELFPENISNNRSPKKTLTVSLRRFGEIEPKRRVGSSRSATANSANAGFISLRSPRKTVAQASPPVGATKCVYAKEPNRPPNSLPNGCVVGPSVSARGARPASRSPLARRGTRRRSGRKALRATNPSVLH